MPKNLPIVEGIDLTNPAEFAHGIPQAAFTAMRERDGLSWIQSTHSLAGFWNVTRNAGVVPVPPTAENYSAAIGHIHSYHITDNALDDPAPTSQKNTPIHTH